MKNPLELTYNPLYDSILPKYNWELKKLLDQMENTVDKGEKSTLSIKIQSMVGDIINSI